MRIDTDDAVLNFERQADGSVKLWANARPKKTGKEGELLLSVQHIKGAAWVELVTALLNNRNHKMMLSLHAPQESVALTEEQLAFEKRRQDAAKAQKAKEKAAA